MSREAVTQTGTAPTRVSVRSGPSALSVFWRNYNLSIVLACLFLLAWLLQTWTGWREFAAEQLAQGNAPGWFGQDGYVWTWASATFENWQSEFLQLLTFVVLTTYLVHKGSHESKDSDEQMRRQIDRIEQKLEKLEIDAGT